MNQSAPLAVNPKQAVALVPGLFGEFAQGTMGPDGRLALIGLPCPRLETRIGYEPLRGPLSSPDPMAAKAMAAARLTLAEIGADGWGGEITIDRPGGAPGGLATTETLGVVRAVARAFGGRLAPEQEAALCLAAEGAVLPLMYDLPVLFAPREGRVLTALSALPAMCVVGSLAGPARGPETGEPEFADMGAVFDDIAAAAQAGDLARLAGAAERSAAANQARNPHPLWDPLGALMPQLGGLGRIVAHNGTAIGVILPPGAEVDTALRALAGLGLADPFDWTLGAGP